MSDAPSSDELQPLGSLTAVESFVLSERPYGYALLRPGQPQIAWLTAPDHVTWAGKARSADRYLRFKPRGRHGQEFVITEGLAEVGRFRRRLNLGGGRLELAGGDRAKLLPVRLWRPRWRIRGSAVAEAVSLPQRSARLTWIWQGDERSAEIALCACFAILVDDLVTAAVPRARVEGMPG